MPEDLLAAQIRRVRSQTVGDIPRRSARRHPHKLAIVDGTTRLTFAELDAHVDHVASALRDSGFGKGDRIALLSHNCWQYAVLTFATARAGVVMVPVNFMLGPDEIAFILGHSKVTGFVVETALVPVADEAMAAAGEDCAVATRIAITSGDPVPAGWQDYADWSQSAATPAPPVEIADDDVLRLMYTSGTESRPKGVMHTSRSLMWQYISSIVAGSMSGEDVEIHSMPLYHCAQLDNFLITDVYLGATSIILPGPDPEAILRTIEAEQVTNFFAPPTVWIALLRCPAFDRYDLTSLRKGYYGASAMPREILHELRDRLPNVSLWNFYGQTEIAPLASSLGPDEQDRHGGAAGRPAVNVETAILDDSDNPVPPGTVGEIAHRSPHLMVGYLDDPQRTAEAFRGDWFHSGDLGYYDEFGLLHVVDRKKDMIKSGGENVASREVEEVLYQHDDVQEAAVFGLPHPVWVEAVVAAVVPREGRVLDPDAVIAHCRSRLAGFKTPKQIFTVAELPKNPSGKLLKRELRERFASAMN
ncbi:acyl-CoA synthetase [Mycolicibacterium gilvum]|uniref:Long-chain-fatty-acid--CoA ligase FadD13 n=2 Tax=Mycolicibacterium gilvum TaxID=1804 RepID=E6TNC2_MYCSR|nr:acyl-CoA synthetase [Mycolicibacterium gilvum]ADU00549.1 acyl-CoA synthetase (AMP-forming)/AMP-acid ligase II [Mycolicibacterium gilvum Spyr1]MCV7055089.1 acyl-CoA synthetase [Mycolicibacterium gilvum]STZ42403.1 acyl-CoA synthetase [Mycolicibacterium gilvum]